jgi:hypothetical protein
MTTPNLLQRFSIEEAIDMYENIFTEFGFMEEFGLVFENHEIVQKNTRSLDGTRVAMSKTRFEKAMKIPEHSMIATRKSNRLHSHNTTRRVYK